METEQRKGVMEVMTYKGIVKGKVVELEDHVTLPEGTKVEVVVKDSEQEEITSSGYPKGSPQAILAIFDTPPRCAPEDVDALMEAIERGKRPVRFEGIFDEERTDR